MSFFPRVDTMLVAVLGINVAMVGFLFSRWPAPSEVTAAATIVVVTYALFAGLALLNLYRCAFPALESVGKSIVYFGSISKLSSASEYAQAFRATEEKEHLDAILHQGWRNSAILDGKFKRIQAAMRWMLIAVAPWVILLMMLPKPVAA
jgi:hypothetical protein